MIACADVRDWCAAYDGPQFHACLCDPPYELGFMGKRWDSTGVAFRPETWAAIGEHLLPGAFLMAFGGSRTFHRLACAIEDAGYIIHPAVVWIYGSGFPKSTRIDTQVDAAAGATQPDKVKGGHIGYGRGAGNVSNNGGLEYDRCIPHVIGKGGYAGNDPQTSLAAAWAGHRYGLQALKPAAEFVCVAQKPYQGKPMDCITTTGAGALNVDGGRVRYATNEGPEDLRRIDGPDSQPRTAECYAQDEWTKTQWKRNCPAGHVAGRWPANLALDLVAAEAMGRQSGVLSAGAYPARRNGDKTRNCYGKFNGDGCTGERIIFDTGTAARFFFQAQWSQIDDAEPFLYQAKASRRERDAGLDAFQVRNPHPTVKPIALARWLATLLLPPAEYAPRRIVVPFAGSGSECIGAGLAGWEDVTGIEQDADNCEIAQARLAHWLDPLRAMEATS